MPKNINQLSPEQTKRLRKAAKAIESGQLGLLTYLIEKEEETEEKLKELKAQIPNLENVAQLIRGKDGDKGEKGDPGEKGEKGKDGRDGRDGRDGADGLDGRDGRDGKDGEMGMVDEATIAYLEAEIKRLEERIGEARQGRTGWGAHPLVVTDGSTVIDKNTRRINFGTNLTVSRAADGTLTVNANTGGGGSTIETPTGTIDGSNTSFTVTAEPTYVVSDGITYFNGAGYTYAALTLTMDVPPSQYIRAIS